MNEEIKDIKLPLDIPSEWAWLWYVGAGFLALVVIGAAIFLMIKWWPKPKPKQEEAPERSAWEKASIRLDNLKLKNLMERKYLKPFYIELSDILRHYLEERFLIKAPEMTTEEFLDSLRQSPHLNAAQHQILKEFLFSCDMVKFAQHESNEQEAQKSFDLVKQFVDQTHGI